MEFMFRPSHILMLHAHLYKLGNMLAGVLFGTATDFECSIRPIQARS